MRLDEDLWNAYYCDTGSWRSGGRVNRFPASERDIFVGRNRFDGSMRINRLADGDRHYLLWHREHVFIETVSGVADHVET